MTLPPIPARGLEEALRVWTGRGSLLEAVAAPVDPLEVDRDWSDFDVLNRARRVVWEQLVPVLATWPLRADAWRDALPIDREREVARQRAPGSGTNWSAARRSGWPMRDFPNARRRRVVQQLTAGILEWTLRELGPLRAAAADPLTAEHETAQRAVDSALVLLDDPLIGVGYLTAPPTPVEVRAVRAEGRPWRALATVCSELRALHDPAAAARFAMRLLAPDAKYAWRLFHLGVLGELLLALRGTGADITSVRPIGAGTGSPGPAFRVQDASGRPWDLWFEAAGAWRAYGVDEPYLEFASAVAGASQPLGTDLLLIRFGDCALLLECKYSNDPKYVVRDGYHQIVSYVSEAVDLAAGAVTGYIVAPTGVVHSRREVNSIGGPVGITSPDDIPIIVEYALAAHESDS